MSSGDKALSGCRNLYGGGALLLGKAKLVPRTVVAAALVDTPAPTVVEGTMLVAAGLVPGRELVDEVAMLVVLVPAVDVV